MDSYRKARETNLAELVAAGIPPRDAMELQRLARRIHKLQEHDCNHGLTPTQERAKFSAECHALGICDAIQGIGPAEIQDDPRGWPITLNGGPKMPRSVCPY